MQQFLLTTNKDGENQISFKDRLQSLISKSKELRVLVGYFYFSGVGVLHDAIKSNPDIKLKILVGMEAEDHMGKIIELAKTQSDMDTGTYQAAFLDSLKNVFGSKDIDDATFFERNKLFIELLRDGRLEIRKTREPNHAKMYLFTMKNDEVDWLTGSANLTWSALENQNEVNVDVSFFDYERANKLFEKWWNDAIPLTEDDNVKKRIIEIIENESVVAPVTPFEAYAKVVKTIAEKENITDKNLSERIDRILKKAGFNNFKYQSDAVLAALSILNRNENKQNGVIIADVVGLGKSIIASLLGNLLTGNGLVICPPNLRGNAKSGWVMYLNKFGLANRGWNTESLGRIESDFDGLLDEVKERDYGTIIIDEAHRFRNQETDSYSKLWRICNGRNVILLTATPFNNSPADFAALLQLFTDLRNSDLIAGGDLQQKFQDLTTSFEAASYLLAHLFDNEGKYFDECKRKWKILFGDVPLNTADIKDQNKKEKIRRRLLNIIQKISNEVREIIAPVTIRRNRLDIKMNPDYAKDVKEMSKVVPPKEQFFELSPEQNNFYDRVINEYLSDTTFTGAAYRPYAYNTAISEDEQSDNVQQEGMYKFMRRLLVRRFESSFGAFAKTVSNAIQYYRHVKQIAITKGIVFQSRKFLDRFTTLCENDASDEEFDQFFEEIARTEQKRTSRNKDELYDVASKCFDKTKFFADLDKDIGTFENILKEIDHLNLLKEDPKALQLIGIVKSVLDCKHKDLDKATNRKVIVFSEYRDTIDHVKKYFDKSDFAEQVLAPESASDDVLDNFDASREIQKDDFDVLLVSDRFSEGLNLSRAGLVINYDIPWNPTRVIQRIGRINRIGQKVFDKLYIFNYFPTEQGSDVIHSREIAANKMAMIHKILGEDAQVLAADEDNPKPSRLYEMVNADPEDSEEISPFTQIKLEWANIQKDYPEIAERVNSLPNRIKSISAAKEDADVGFYVLKKKGSLLWTIFQNEAGERKLIHAIDLAMRLKCKVNEKALLFNKDFWDTYKELSELDPKSIEQKNTSTMPKNDAYAKAKKVIVEALSVASPGSDIYEFLQIIQDDLDNWRTIPRYDLKIIANCEGRDLDGLYERLGYLREMLQKSKDNRRAQREEAKKEDEVVIGIQKV